MEKNENLVDIERILKTKNPKLYKFLPGFIIRYIKKTIHEDQINETISKYSDYYELDFVSKILEHFEIKTEVFGLDNIPQNGRFIFAANHPIGSFDGIAFMDILGKKYGITKSLVNDLLTYIKNYGSLFLGVNKHGSNPKDAIKEIDEVFSSDYQVIIYPAGLASRKKKGKIRDLEWKKTFISRAKKYKRDIIPVHITGNLSNFFYNLSNIRSFLGIKSNLEMFYLVDETFKQKGKTIEFRFGKPISFSTFDDKFSDTEWAQKVKQHVYNIGEKDINSIMC